MRADDDVDFSGFEISENDLLFGGGAKAAEHFYAGGKCREAFLERLEVLKGENGGGGEYGDLLAVGDSLESGTHGDFRFAIADIAAKESIHGGKLFEIALDVANGVELIGSFFELERVFEF